MYGYCEEPVEDNSDVGDEEWRYTVTVVRCCSVRVGCRMKIQIKVPTSGIEDARFRTALVWIQVANPPDVVSGGFAMNANTWGT